MIGFDVAKYSSANLLRTSTSTDVIGVEIGGAVKNMTALTAGMC